MKHVITRNATRTDIPKILKLAEELGRPSPQGTQDTQTFEAIIETYITDTDKQILVADIRDANTTHANHSRIIGVVSLIFLTRLNQRTLEMYIPELVVSKKYRECGIGKKLIDSCIAIATKSKCHRIRLESANYRSGSHRFYKHLGFKQSALSFEFDCNG